jgi:hypothetical protein
MAAGRADSGSDRSVLAIPLSNRVDSSAPVPMRQVDPAAPAHRWWKVETAPAQSVDALQDQFRAIFESAGSPPGAALFCDHVLLDAPALLFTPAAAAIAQHFIEAHGGVLCAEPAAGIFLVGNDSDRNLLAVPELTKPSDQPACRAHKS